MFYHFTLRGFKKLSCSDLMDTLKRYFSKKVGSFKLKTITKRIFINSKIKTSKLSRADLNLTYEERGADRWLAEFQS